MSEDKPPVVECTETRGWPKTWTFWCRYCEVYHVHSAEAGHRVAHCFKPDSPYKDGGYILRLKNSDG